MRHDLTRDKPPPHPTGWVGIDSRQVLPAADLEVVGRLTAMSRELDQLVRRLPGVLHMMRDTQAGQPPSALARLGNDPDAPPPRRWCWEHERYTTECDELGLLCTGKLDVGATDRTGNAAMTPDQAALHHRMLVADADRLVKTFARMLGTAAGYPTVAIELEDPEPDDDVGTLWCRSCWKDNKHCEPITMRKDSETPYYRGLCLWCGRTRRAIGGNRLADTNPAGDPPTWLVAKKHRGDRITPGDLAKATDQVDRHAAGAASKGKKRRKRKG